MSTISGRNAYYGSSNITIQKPLKQFHKKLGKPMTCLVYPATCQQDSVTHTWFILPPASRTVWLMCDSWLQCDSPCLSCHLPAGHSVQIEARGSLLNDPGAHGLQNDDPAMEYFPTLQSLHNFWPEIYSHTSCTYPSYNTLSMDHYFWPKFGKVFGPKIILHSN